MNILSVSSTGSTTLQLCSKALASRAYNSFSILYRIDDSATGRTISAASAPMLSVSSTGSTTLQHKLRHYDELIMALSVSSTGSTTLQLSSVPSAFTQRAGFQYPLPDRRLCNDYDYAWTVVSPGSFSILYRIDDSATDFVVQAIILASVSFSILYRIDDSATVFGYACCRACREPFSILYRIDDSATAVSRNDLREHPALSVSSTGSTTLQQHHWSWRRLSSWSFSILYRIDDSATIIFLRLACSV